MTGIQPTGYRLGYRGDIEGLRALAILLVVAAHANVSWLAGGFVGVDIFFVLSGYLITGLLVQEINGTGDLRFAAFYARRLRRLMPALLLVLLCTCLFAYLLLIPIAQLGQARAAGGAALWLSNFYFAFSNLNYFSPDAKSNLFLHTWSLGVEEQFYLVWPLLVVLVAGAWQGARKAPQPSRLKVAMPVVFVLSLSLCLWWTAYAPHLAFYMMPSRAWQFALGALVFAYFGSPRVSAPASSHSAMARDRWLVVAAWTGLAMILFAAVYLNGDFPYPGAWALLPAFGAALIIAGGAHSARLSGVNRILSHRYLQGIGRVSYSWYLWHWPVLLLGAVVLDFDSVWNRLALVGLSFVCAVLSYRYFEAPIRHNRKLLLKPRVTVVAALGVMVLALGVTLHWYHDSERDMKSPDQVRYLQAEWDAPVIYNMGCDDWYFSDRVTVCSFGDSNARHTAVLMGDSVGAQWAPAIRQVFSRPGWRLLVLTKSSCPMVDEPFFYARIGRVYRNCSNWRKGAVEKLRKLKPDMVILGSTYTYGFTRNQWIEGTGDLLRQLSGNAKYIYILRSTPVLPFDGPTCLAPRSWLYKALTGDHGCSSPAYNRRSDKVYSWLQTTARRFPNVYTVDMTSQICPGARCQAELDGMIVFRDDQHLTATFVKSLSGKLAKHFAANLQSLAASGPR